MSEEINEVDNEQNLDSKRELKDKKSDGNIFTSVLKNLCRIYSLIFYISFFIVYIK